MRVIHADCLDAMAAMDADSVDAIVSDPPYGLSFMGKQWDHGVPGEPFWREALRVAKPGAHLVAFGGTRTYHRLACAIEDAGWEIRDCLSWNFGSGFPKSHNIDKTGVSCACDDDLPGMRPRVLSPTVTRQEVQSPVVFAEVQRDGKGEGVGKPRSQGPCGVDSGLHGIVPVQDARPIESGMEGRRHLEAPEGELLGRPVRPSAGMGAADGAEGRLHIGASVGHGAEGAAIARPDGSGASPEPRPIGQSTGEPGTLADERIAQAGGVWPTCDGCGKPRIARGLGTALKPAWEPIILARKPLIGTVAANVAAHGTGALNVDGCRIGTDGGTTRSEQAPYPKNDDGTEDRSGSWARTGHKIESLASGRWPANVCLDEDAAAMLDEQSGERKAGVAVRRNGVRDEVGGIYGRGVGEFPKGTPDVGYGDTGGASRFFFVAREGQCDSVSNAETSSSQSSGLDGSAPSGAATSGNREAVRPSLCQRGQGCTADCTDCTPRQSRASSAEEPDSIGTTPTTPTCCGSCGSVLRATGDSTSPASVARVADANDPVSGTRFLYSPKASRREREAGLEGMEKRPSYMVENGSKTAGAANGVRYERHTVNANHHPTVKPIALMRWLCRLVTPPNGLILDPFTGSGTTGCAAVLEGFRFVGIEREAEYVAIAEKRIAHWASQRTVPEPDLFTEDAA